MNIDLLRHCLRRFSFLCGVEPSFCGEAVRGGFVIQIATPNEKWLKGADTRSNRLTIKGQVTIPKEIRDFLGLQEGNSSVEFVVTEDGSVTVRKAGREEEKPRHRGLFSRTVPRQAVIPPAHAASSRRGGGVLALLAGGY